MEDGKDELTQDQLGEVDIDSDSYQSHEVSDIPEMSRRKRSRLFKALDSAVSSDAYKEIRIDTSTSDIEDEYRRRLFPNDIIMSGSIKILKNSSEKVTFYTDGSYAHNMRNSAGGIGIIGLTEKGDVWCAGQIALKGLGAISTGDTETLGIIMAYRIAREQGVVCQAIRSDLLTASSTVQKLLPQIDCVEWVRGHDGSGPNVVADALAKRALRDALTLSKKDAKTPRHGCRARVNDGMSFLQGEYGAGRSKNRNDADSVYILCDLEGAGEAHYIIAYISRSKRKIVHVTVGHILCQYGQQLDILATIIPQYRGADLFVNKPLYEIMTLGETDMLKGSEISGISMRDFAHSIQKLGYSEVKTNDVFRNSVTAAVLGCMRDSEVLGVMKSKMTPALIKAQVDCEKQVAYRSNGVDKTMTLNPKGNPFSPSP